MNLHFEGMAQSMRTPNTQTTPIGLSTRRGLPPIHASSSSSTTTTPSTRFVRVQNHPQSATIPITTASPVLRGIRVQVAPNNSNDPQ